MSSLAFTVSALSLSPTKAHTGVLTMTAACSRSPRPHKGAAAAYLARRWSIDPQRVVVAGDSGNDAAMFHMGFRGIVVGNARPELRSLVSPDIYHATAEFAAGVLEGLEYWLQAPLVGAATADRSSQSQGANHGMRG